MFSFSSDSSKNKGHFVVPRTISYANRLSLRHLAPTVREAGHAFLRLTSYAFVNYIRIMLNTQKYNNRHQLFNTLAHYDKMFQ
jgi:hypothetical protein